MNRAADHVASIAGLINTRDGKEYGYLALSPFTGMEFDKKGQMSNVYAG